MNLPLRLRHVSQLIFVAILLLVLLSLPPAPPAVADEGWIVRSFDATYQLRPDAVALITEDIRVDFGSLEKHGIFRDIPVEYKYDAKHNRLIAVEGIRVDDGQRPWNFTASRVGANLRIKIGDANRTISGPQRYRISYQVRGAFNSFDDHDELFWNVTGNEWPVPMSRVTMSGNAPARDVTCFQGPRGSKTPCRSEISGNDQRFEANGGLRSGEGLTIVLATEKGLIQAPPPRLVRVKSAVEQVKDFVGLRPGPIALAVALAVALPGFILRQWWVAGRDRWYGDVHYLRSGTKEMTRPPFARETIVVEYTPPEMEGKRRLRPAEMGLLLDERADTLDVSATIIDLAVRGYLRITEEPKTWLFGKSDYKLTRLKPADSHLLPYESLLHEALFADGESVDMSDLREKFYEDLAKVKTALEEQGVSADKFFAKKPATTRMIYFWAGVAMSGFGVVAILALGSLGMAIAGTPIVVAGLLVMALSGAMPRRTASGREMFRRSLGFRRYMTVAETERQRFAEDANIFSEYLPYAIVMGCTEKWAERFEDLGSVPGVNGGGWYVGQHAFAPLLFASSINSFSSSMSSAIASTPASSGGSGFSGGSSGGGFGGGGGGSW